MLVSAGKKEQLLMATSFEKTPVLESLFNSEYCELFKNIYFEEHLHATASEKMVS